MTSTIHDDYVGVRDSASGQRTLTLRANGPRITLTTPGISTAREGDLYAGAGSVAAELTSRRLELQGFDHSDNPGGGHTVIERHQWSLYRNDRRHMSSIHPDRIKVATDLDSNRSELTSYSVGVSGPFNRSNLSDSTLTLGGTREPSATEIVAAEATGREVRSGRIQLSGQRANAHLGGEGQDGDLMVYDQEGALTIGLNGAAGQATLGGHRTNGVVRLMDGENRVVVEISAADARGWPSEGAPDGTVHLLRELKALKERVDALQAQVDALS